MAHQDGGGAALDDFPHLGFAFLAEGAVADTQHLVQDEDIRLDQGGDGEGQSAFHPGGQLLEGAVLEVCKFRKLDDLPVGLVHELPGIAQHGPPEVGVLPDGEVPVEAAG